MDGDELRTSVTQERADVKAGEAFPPSETTVGIGVSREQSRRLRVPAVLWFPILVVVAVVVLGGLGLSGSSVSVYAGASGDGGRVAGRARELRTDEWWVRTPLVVRQVALDLPDHDWIGVGEHDMGVVADLPTRGWETFLRPHTLPYHVVGLERAFALEWWLNYLALPAIGVYLLVWMLGVRPLPAALVSLIVVWSPFVQWWTGSWTGTIGYATLAGAALLGATRVRSTYARVAMSALAGWLGACLVIVLYPSTVIPSAFLVGAVVVAAVVATFPPRERRRGWWLRMLVVVGVGGAMCGVLVVAFFLAHQGALSAIADSVYPGRRRSSGGSGHLRVLFGAPFDLIESTRSSTKVSVNGLNQSEAAASLFTVFAVAAAVFVDRTRIPWRPWRTRVVLLGVLGASAVLLGWYALPIPEAVGRLVLFDRVRPDRLLLPLAIASALALGLYFEEQRRSEGQPLVPVVAGAIAFAVPTLWAGLELRVDGEFAPRWQVLLLAAASTFGVALALRGSRIGLWLLVGLFAAGAAATNPLQHGLDPLVDSAGAQLGRTLRARPGTGAVLNFWGNDITARSQLTVSGVDLVSGVNLYPNATAWRVLDPSGRYRHVWDSYNNAEWSPGPPGSAPRIEGVGDTIYVTVDPCDGRLARLGVKTIVSVQPLSNACLVQTDSVGPLAAYRVDRSAGR